MKKGIISRRFLLYLLMLMFLVSAFGCSSSDNAAVATTYGISGTVTGAVQAGVAINLTGASTATATTNADGEYTFAGLANGSYTVTPVLAGYVFAPISTAVTVNGSNMVADFVATASGADTYSISGTVSGAVASGVEIRLTGDNTGSVTTGAGGTYTFTGLLAGNYTVTPYLSGYVFTPEFRDVALAANSTGNNFTAAAQAYSQADLVGSWNVQRLKAGTENGWGRYNVTINIGGTLSFISCEESSGSTTCPAVPIVWTIDPTTGVITQTEDGTPTDMHLSMTSNKNFIAGTISGSSQLFIAQKKEDGVSYSNADLQSKNFVIHSLMVDGENEWLYAQGYTDSNRIVILTSETSPAGTQPGENTGSAISVDANGIVTISGTGMSTYRGFLSYDKKTIVGTYTDDGDIYQLMIIQITGKSYTAGPVPAGTMYGHILGVGALDFWAHYINTINDSGVMSFNNWEDNSASVDPPSPMTASIDATGKITIAENPTYHGQQSDDGTFSVGTQTRGTDPNFIYLLTVTTR